MSTGLSLRRLFSLKNNVDRLTGLSLLHGYCIKTMSNNRMSNNRMPMTLRSHLRKDDDRQIYI